MRRWLVVMGLVASSAWAMGPVVSAGAVVTLKQSATDTAGSSVVAFNNLVGPIARAGFELGDRFNHELSFQWSLAVGKGTSSGIEVPVQVMTLALRYTFSVDFFTKQGLEGLPGFTPTLGVGSGLGAFQASVPGQQQWGPWLEFHAVAGARYTLKSGLNFRLEAAVSTYGGFFAVQPSLSVGYQL